MDPTQPFDDLPPLPPRGVETGPVLRRLTTTARALAAMDAASRSLHDPSILINTIPLQEAQASSAIENVVTTQDELYQAFASETESQDPATRETLRYRTALRDASDAVTQNGYRNDLLGQVCSTVLDARVPVRQGGEFVHLRGPDGIAYTPPANAVILRDLLDNLEEYIRHSPHDGIVRMAVAHYQFEAIHPFRDGNGRTGRILCLLVLQHCGLLHLPILYLSKYIIERKNEYYRLLQDVTAEGAWEPWLLWMLEGVEQTSNETTRRIERVNQLQEETTKRLRQEAPQLLRHGIMDVLFRQPYCKISFLVQAGVAKRQTASKYLQELEQMGILESHRRGREMIYRHPALIEAIR